MQLLAASLSRMPDGFHGFLKEHRTPMRFQWIKKGFPQQEISHGESGSSTHDGSEGSQEYVYDYAHIRSGLGGALPKQWVTVTNAQVHRLVYVAPQLGGTSYFFVRPWRGDA